MKNTLVELVSNWADFAEVHPQGTLEEFCRHYLASQQSRLESQTTTNAKGQLIRAIGRIGSAYAIYHKAAMAEMMLPTTDSFYYLNGLNTLGECKKMDLINYLLSETTTGMDAIQKLVNAKLVSERSNDQDRRARLISLTSTGKKKLALCYKISAKVNEVIFHNIDVEQLRVCLDVLSKVEQMHSQRSIQLKGKPFEEIYQAILAS